LLDAMIARLAPLHAPARVPRPGDWLAEHHEPGQTFADYRASDPVRVDLTRDRRNKLYVQPLGELGSGQRRIVTLTSDFLARFFGIPTSVAPDLGLELVPDSARRTHPNDGGRQLLTGYILERVLLPRLPSDAAAFISFTTADLWPGDGYSFVFGQASLHDRVGVWSLHRFGDSDATDATFRLALLRAMKVAAHETGHMFSMKHCIAYQCVMAGSNHLEETDASPLWLCPECLAKLSWATGIDPREHHLRLAEFCEQHGLLDQARFFRTSSDALEAPRAWAPAAK
jgi:archaemetzincin